MSKKRTILLSKENYLFLFDLVSGELEAEKKSADLSYYENGREIPDWVKENAEESVKNIPVLEKIRDAILFGDDEE